MLTVRPARAAILSRIVTPYASCGCASSVASYLEFKQTDVASHSGVLLVIWPTQK